MEELERRQLVQAADIAAIYKLVKKLVGPPRQRRQRPIGFITGQ